MQSQRTRATVAEPDLNAAERLALSLAVIVQQAQHLPHDSTVRSALVGAIPPLLDTLDDVTGARRITLDRAAQLADAAVGAGLASWGADDAFQAGPAVRRWLDDVGVSMLAEFHVDEADDFASFAAAA
jgi:hypothetical protein